MSLTDLMSGMHLDVYPQIGLVLFLGVFIVLVSRVFASCRRGEYQQAAELPLQDEPGSSTESKGLQS